MVSYVRIKINVLHARFIKDGGIKLTLKGFSSASDWIAHVPLVIYLIGGMLHHHQIDIRIANQLPHPLTP